MSEVMILYGTLVAFVIIVIVTCKLYRRYSSRRTLLYSTLGAIVPYFALNVVLYGVGIYSPAAIIIGLSASFVLSVAILLAIELFRLVRRSLM